MENIYLAARTARRDQLKDYAQWLIEQGKKITSSWIYKTPLESYDTDDLENKLLITNVAIQDLKDLKSCDTIICFTEENGSYQRGGGRHVEFGMALALGKTVIVIGELENVFYCLPEVQHYPTWKEFTKVVSKNKPIVNTIKYTINLFGCSGGKDSTALMLWAIHKSGYDPETVRFTFCDTGNEAPETYEQIKLLSEHCVKHGFPPIITLKPEMDFYELCIHKKIFPSARRRFCTESLKLEPFRDYCYYLENQGHKVLVHTGVRAQEKSSGKNDRSKLPEWDIDTYSGLPVYRPLLRWTIEDVWAIHEEYGIPRNPLYDLGMRRVGCFPCIMSNKKELRSILKHRPERVDYLKEKEALVQNAVGDSSNGIMRTFFHANTIPLKVRTGPEILDSKGRPSRITTIDDVFRWSLTKWGGTEIDTDVDYDEPVSCASSSGMCE